MNTEYGMFADAPSLPDTARRLLHSAHTGADLTALHRLEAEAAALLDRHAPDVRALLLAKLYRLAVRLFEDVTLLSGETARLRSGLRIAERQNKRLHEHIRAAEAAAGGLLPTVQDGGPVGVYFVQDRVMGLVNIGATRNLSRRLAAYATHSPAPVALVGFVATDAPFAVERRLHQRFASARVRGEWHTPTPELVDYVRCLSHQP